MTPDYVEYQIFDGEEFYAEVSGPREQAMNEALMYAEQCDGPARVEQITRRVVWPTPHSACTTEAEDITQELQQRERAH